MPKIFVIDDDYASEILTENLRFRSYDAVRCGSATEALGLVDEIATADLVILDIIMERPKGSGAQNISGDKTTGMDLLHAFRQKYNNLKILVFSATNDPNVIHALNRAPHTTFISKWNAPSLNDLIDKIEHMIGGSDMPILPRSFIVHGHDTVEKLALKNYLQNTLGFPEPIILHEQPNLGRTIIEKLENYATAVDLAFVLLTPDDKLLLEDGTNDLKRRARQNVIFELGYFLGVFGRLSVRVFLLHKGSLDLPSDLSGVVYIDISNGVNAAGEDIRKEIAHVIN